MFKLFKKYPYLIYGISQKHDGNMKLGEFIGSGKNRKKYFIKRGLGNFKVAAAKLVHSTNVKIVKQKGKDQLVPKADGLMTNDKNLLLSVTVADCFPVYFYDPKNKALGLIHCGWKGTAGKIALEVVEKMKAIYATDPKNLVVGIGPGIRNCHFEIKNDVLKFFKGYGDAVLKKKYKTYLDLPTVITSQLLQAGVNKKSIEDSGICTFCQEKQYFSYRRDKPKLVSAMVSFIGMR